MMILIIFAFQGGMGAQHLFFFIFFKLFIFDFLVDVYVKTTAPDLLIFLEMRFPLLQTIVKLTIIPFLTLFSKLITK